MYIVHSMLYQQSGHCWFWFVYFEITIFSNNLCTHERIVLVRTCKHYICELPFFILLFQPVSTFPDMMHCSPYDGGKAAKRWCHAKSRCAIYLSDKP